MATAQFDVKYVAYLARLELTPDEEKISIKSGRNHWVQNEQNSEREKIAG